MLPKSPHHQDSAFNVCFPRQHYCDGEVFMVEEIIRTPIVNVNCYEGFLKGIFHKSA